MKCFLPCFSSSKRQKHFSSKPAYTHHETDLEESIHWISQSKIENEEEKSQCVNNTNDLETKEKETKDNHEEECSDSLFSVSITCGKPVSISIEENEVNSTPIKPNHAKDESVSALIVPFKEPKIEEQPNEAKDLDEKARPVNQSILEYRYRDCSDDGYDDINLDADEKTREEEEEEKERSSESSLFSLSTDYNCRKRISFSSTTEKEVSSRMVPTQEESEGNNDDACSSVLKPIENVLHSAKKDKENMNWNQAETSLKVLSSNRKMKEKEEIRVDTSLSSWLVESENNTPKKVCYGEDRQILGALKVEETRNYSPNVSSKSSRSLSPEETPIIGTVGSYWNHSGQTRSPNPTNMERMRNKIGVQQE